MYHGFLIHSSADGHLGCSHVLAIINSAAMNIGVHVSLSILVFSVCMPSSGIAGSYLFWDPEFPNEFSISLSNSVKKPVVRTPWTAAYQAPPSMGFSRQEYWSRVPLPSPCNFDRNCQICRSLLRLLPA